MDKRFSKPSLRLTRIVLGVTGGIAAYKAAELTRLLVKDGVSVDVVMTNGATQFVTPMTFQALSGRAVHTSLWASGADNAMGHIALSRGADAIVVPAMNRQMWSNAATQRNVATLRADGVSVLGPDSGDQACGEVGDGRMLEPAAIHASLQALTAAKVLAGKRVLLTAGPTFEAIDPVRGITNTSSGKMGYALAQAAAEAGASVTLVSGPTSLATPAGVSRVDVVSAAQMADAVDSAVGTSDIFVGVAAVADYTPEKFSERKMKKNGAAMTLALKPTADILARVAARNKPPFCVGFAAESHDVEKHAQEKRRNKKLPLIIANRAQDALGSNDNEVVLIDDTGLHPLPKMDKLSLARRLVTEIAARLPK